MTLSLSPARRVLLAAGFAVAVSAAPLVAAVTTTAGTALAACPSTEVLDPASGACKPVTDVTPSTLNPIEPGNVQLQPGEVTSAKPGDVGTLPEVDGIPCTGASKGGGGTGECIGLEESAKGATAHVPTVVPEVTG